MRRGILLFLTVLLLAAANVYAIQPQKKRKSSQKPAASKTINPPPIIQVRVRFTNGREYYGRLIDINLKGVSIDAGNAGVVTASLQEVASLTIGETAAKKMEPQFFNDADTAYRSLLALSIATDAKISYGEYQPKLNEAKVAVEAFLARYENSGQKELINTMRAALRSYEVVLPVWSLRLGQEQHKYVTDTSEQMKPVLELFPEIKQVTWKRNDRYPIENVIAWVWLQAARFTEQSKQQLARLR
ncbi:MAG: hypothetical protein AB1489_20095 [Acidobacteriota bacterium]